MSRASIPGPNITRRDFVAGTLVGAGATLVGGCGANGGSEAPPAAQGPGAAWNGPSGVGDYAGSNGNSWRTVEAGHQIRGGSYPEKLANAADAEEQYDLVIVGGGFTGLGALHEFRRTHPSLKVLLLDNQEIFGGYGKANAFALGGLNLQGPQASLNFVLPQKKEDRGANYWDELGLPRAYPTVERQGGNSAVRFSRSTSAPLYLGEQSASVGYWFGPQAGMVTDIWSDDLARAPFPPATRAALLRLRAHRRKGPPQGTEARRLDAMTFADFASRDLGATPEALAYITQGMCITGPQISAYGARSLPGLERYASDSKEALFADRFISFPGGNTLIARAIVKAAIPNAFRGDSSLNTLADAPLDFAALDRPGQQARIRQQATVVRVEHVGDPAAAEQVDVIYAHNGQLARVRARGVVMGIGNWVAKHVVADLPDDRRAALDNFLYSPMLMVNVALRNWRFLDKAGISAARWFEGFGFFGNIRQPLQIGRSPIPFHPDQPIIMTIYAPFPNPNLPLEAQGPAGRQQLFDTPFADYERKVVDQLRAMFEKHGFNAPRDIAGIILNRWGHAFVTPPPGFFFGLNGGPPPLELATKRLGRITFGQSGLEDWSGAADAGRRAVRELDLA